MNELQKQHTRKRKEKTEKKYELTEEYNELFEHAPICYFVTNRNDVITNVNRMAIEQVNCSREELIGKKLGFYISKLSHDHYKHHRKLVISTQARQRLECRVRKEDGSDFFALLQSSIVKDERKKKIRLLSTISNITTYKEQEQQLEISLLKEKEFNQLKSQFISIASHEFRTPLATILTSAELIEKYDGTANVFDKKRKKHFRKIKTSISRLKEILIDFLSANEIEKGQTRNMPAIFNLNVFTKELIEEVKAFNGIHNIIYKGDDVHPYVYLDQRLLKTCMSNLLINAYKYSPAGGTIEIATKQNRSGGVTIRVKDEGIGIPAQDQPAIFGQFYRARNAGTIQGTGLGLYITHKFTTLMGGTIRLESEENKGSVFTMHFPAGKKSKQGIEERL